ncbi:MAG TPA: hypothetical protein VJI15_00770 [Candidatus Nanoarchaeia archaeon]|nr:hypothetical protein [Candidatus Nanoarchaeia archaeon]
MNEEIRRDRTPEISPIFHFLDYFTKYEVVPQYLIMPTNIIALVIPFKLLIIKTLMIKILMMKIERGVGNGN